MLGAEAGLPASFALLALLASAPLLLATQLWPRDDPKALTHQHAGLAHSHAFAINEEHPKWPR